MSHGIQARGPYYTSSGNSSSAEFSTRDSELKTVSASTRMGRQYLKRLENRMDLYEQQMHALDLKLTILLVMGGLVLGLALLQVCLRAHSPRSNW